MFFDEDYEPVYCGYGRRMRHHNDYPVNSYFIDMEGKLRFYKDEENLLKDTRTIIRKIKIKNLLKSCK